MATRKANTDLAYLSFHVKAGKDFDDSQLPATVLAGWEEDGLCSKASGGQAPAKAEVGKAATKEK